MLRILAFRVKKRETRGREARQVRDHFYAVMQTGHWWMILGRKCRVLLPYSLFSVLVPTDLGSLWKKESRLLYSSHTDPRAPKKFLLLS